MKTLFLDFETKSRLDLKKVSAPRYLDHGQITWLSYLAPGAAEPVSVQFENGYCDRKATEAFLEAVNEAEVIVAHNAVFDMLCCRQWCRQVELATMKRWCCTQAICDRLKIPASLDGVSNYLGIGNKLEMPSPLDTPEAWKRYVQQDVILCQKVYETLAPATAQSELDLIDAHLQMVYHGVAIDTENLADLIDKQKSFLARIEKRFVELTGLKPTQAQKIGEWMAARGLPKSSSTKILGPLLNTELPTKSRQAIELLVERKENEKAKLEKMLEEVSTDGRLRDTLRINGSITNRWTGSGAHLHNAKRGGIARQQVIAGGNAKLFVADLAQIEVRAGLWVSGMLAALQDLHEHDWYMNLAKDIYGPNADRKTHRQRVKSAVIGAMYAGGIGALQEAVKCSYEDAEHLYTESNRLMSEVIGKSKKLFATMLATVADKQTRHVELHNGYKITFKWYLARNVLMVKLPVNNAILYYHAPTIETGNYGSDQVKFFHGKKACWLRHRGQLYEHICSSISREIMANAVVRISKLSAVHIAYTIHDELICEVAALADAKWTEKAIIDGMCKATDLTGFLVAAEGGYQDRWAGNA